MDRIGQRSEVVCSIASFLCRPATSSVSTCNIEAKFLTSTSDKQLMCKPPGAKYERLQLYPDLLISVPTKTAGLNVPAVIVENGAEEAGFDAHKDSVKVLAETRMATTFSLSKCEIKDAFCYGIVNGGSKMSVTLNNVTLELQGGSTEHIQQQQSKIKSRRLYQSSFILPTQQQDPARQLFSVEYNKANYKDIILVLVTIFCHISIMRTWKARKETLSFTTHQSTPQKPDVDGFGKTKKQDKPDGKRDGGNEEKKGGDDKGKGSSNPSTNYSGPPLRKHSTIMIGSEKCVVTDVVSAKALILKQCNRNKSYFAKVFQLVHRTIKPWCSNREKIRFAASVRTVLCLLNINSYCHWTTRTYSSPLIGSEANQTPST